jgi:hypothetical protein
MYSIIFISLCSNQRDEEEERLMELPLRHAIPFIVGKSAVWTPTIGAYFNVA